MSGVLRISLFSLYHFRTARLDRLRKKERKKKHGKKDRLIFPVSISFLFFFLRFFKISFFVVVVVVVVKICVCIYFLVGFNLFDFLLIRVF